MSETRAFASFREFYPFYLSEHANVACRRLHFVGSSLVLGCVLMLVVAAMLEGYGRQLVGETASRFVIGGFMLAFWLAYFFAFRRRGAGELP